MTAYKIWRNESRMCWTVAVPDIFGKLSPVLNAAGEPETITEDEANEAPSAEAWRLKVDSIVASCRRPMGPSTAARPPE